MKKLLTLLVFLCSLCAFAQDVIVKKRQLNSCLPYSAPIFSLK